ncbi:MAG: hypothetical protein HY553_06760 [Elusimicrobia bacterium]|nr:hypothetical protein [Elusimicrobiota bacterium]
MSPRSGFDPKPLPLLLVAGILLGAGLLVQKGSAGGRPGRTPRETLPAWGGPSLSVPSREQAAGAAAESRLFREPAKAEDPPPITLDEFVASLQTRVPAPLAKKVAREFMKEPMLNEAWKQYKRQRGGKAPAANFVDFISRVPQFRQLVARFQGEPGFKQAFANAVKPKEISSALREGMAAAAGGMTPSRSGRSAGLKRHGGAGSVDAAAIAKEWEKKAHSGVQLGGGFSGTPPRDRVPVTSIASIGGAGHAGGGAGARQGAMAGGDRGEGAASGRATPLDKSWRGEQITDQGRAKFEGDRRLMTVLMKSLTPGEIEALEKALCANPKYPCEEPHETNIWGACWKTGLYERCRELCLTGAAQDCEASMTGSPYNACRASGDVRPPSNCVKACLDTPPTNGCTQASILQTEWDDACKMKTLPDPSYCTKTQPWGTGCHDVTLPNGTVECRPDMGSRDGSADADYLATITDTGSGTGTGTATDTRTALLDQCLRVGAPVTAECRGLIDDALRDTPLTDTSTGGSTGTETQSTVRTETNTGTSTGVPGPLIPEEPVSAGDIVGGAMVGAAVGLGIVATIASIPGAVPALMAIPPPVVAGAVILGGIVAVSTVTGAIGKVFGWW